MDKLVESLMEELNCNTVFTIPLFGGIPATGAIARTATNVKNGGVPRLPVSRMPWCCC